MKTRINFAACGLATVVAFASPAHAGLLGSGALTGGFGNPLGMGQLNSQGSLNGAFDDSRSRSLRKPAQAAVASAKDTAASSVPSDAVSKTSSAISGTAASSASSASNASNAAPAPAAAPTSNASPPAAPSSSLSGTLDHSAAVAGHSAATDASSNVQHSPGTTSAGVNGSSSSN